MATSESKLQPRVPEQRAGGIAPIPLIPQERLEGVGKILVCQLRQLGDVLLSTASLELLRRRFPLARIDFFTEKKCLPLLENNPNVNLLWPLDKDQLSSFAFELGYYWGISRQNYDLIVDFQQLPRLRWLSLFSPKAVRLTFTPPWYNRIFYSHWSEPEHGYAAAYKASVLRPLGIEWQGERPRIYLRDSEKEAADSLLGALGYVQGQTLLTLDPTHRYAPRRWPLEHYAKLLTLAAAQRPNLRVFPLCGPGEEEELQRLASLCDELEPGFSAERLLLPGRLLSLRESSAVISRAALHLGNCSAPRHMAVAVGTPTLSILGASSRAWTFPAPEHADISADLDCQPCGKNVCSIGLKCLVELTPELVLPKLLECLGGC